jgi:putative glycosyltransferase (TIGR04348 family)
MRIQIVTPVPPGSRKGNRITALRWAGLLRQLGHRVSVEQRWRPGQVDLLLALHARKSFESIERCRRQRPEVPIVLALTGTDVYDEMRHIPQARHAIEMADRLVVLQPLAIEELPPAQQPKARVIYQSCEPAGPRPGRRDDVFEVCVMGHLRPVKDPFQTARAARLLPSDSRIRVLHLGEALTDEMDDQVQAEMRDNPRYDWLGDVPRARALRILARCRLLVLTSKLEGGANVISEAVVAGTPVLASRIAGSIGLLGCGYPGYFAVGDTAALARLLRRAETDRGFYRRLDRWCAKLRPLFRPARERLAWRGLLAELSSAAGRGAN